MGREEETSPSPRELLGLMLEGRNLRVHVRERVLGGRSELLLPRDSILRFQ